MQGCFAKLLPDAEWRNRFGREPASTLSRILTLAEIKEDAAWKSDMPRTYRSLVAALTFPLRKSYGYP